MKVTSLKPQKPQRLLPPAEEKSNKDFTCNQGKKKAVISTCLFLLLPFFFNPLIAQQWVFDENSRKAYDLVLNLQLEEAMALIPEPKTPQDYYVVSLAEALELIITEDRSKFDNYETHYHNRLLANIKCTPQDYQFLIAEMNLQWAFVYLKFGQEFEAGARMRESYMIAEKCKRKYHRYLAIKKTVGLLEVIIGSVPEKYNWLLSVLGMHGSLAHGMHDLEAVRTSGDALAFEADVLYCLTQGFIFQKPEVGYTEFKKILSQQSGNRVALFFGAALAIKNSQSEDALELLNKLAEHPPVGYAIYYADYLKGEVYLHKGDYTNAVASYRYFVNHYSGENYRKDAFYKIGLCYWLSGNANDASLYFRDARAEGKDIAEADKSAARSLAEKKLPHITLSKARYATDGGYYDEARQLLNSITDKDLPGLREQVEYFYRKARLEHKTNHLHAAELFYKQTIEMAGNEDWYFAPNSCLQIGYIMASEARNGEARKYFQKALTYKRHEYKNSIDSKAKSALVGLKNPDSHHHRR
jgi:predicted negative regulator of RcsB-dependent stress response